MNSREILIEYGKMWEKKVGSKFTPLWGRDGRIISRLIKDHGSDEVLARLEAYLEDESDFCYRVGYNIPVFLANFGQYDKKMANTYRARVETRKQRKKLIETPKREPSHSEPKAFEDLLKKWIEGTE